jgi:hypothetical protein
MALSKTKKLLLVGVSAATLSLALVGCGDSEYLPGIQLPPKLPSGNV